MRRFFALIWNSQDPEATAAAALLASNVRSASEAWSTVFDADGMKVLALGSRARDALYTLRLNGGVVVGRIFRNGRDDSARTSHALLNEPMSEKIVRTKGCHLAEHYWGAYVAFVHEKDRNASHIFRDPTGGLRCFYTRAHGVDVFFSDLEDYTGLTTARLTLNHSHVGAFLWNPRLVTRETGFQEVHQLLGGECMTVRRGATSKVFHWSPSSVYEQDALEQPERAISSLRAAVRGCVHAWASSYHSVLHELSGGLDSSIVAACLGSAHGGPKIVCLNVRTESEEGNELAYADLTAHHVGLELVEGQWRTSARPLSTMLDAGSYPTPTMTILASESEELKARLAAERDVDAIFSGQGGDHLFHYRKTTLVAAEYVHRHGLRPHLATIMTDTSRLTRRSVWSVFGTAIRHGLFRGRFDPNIEHKLPVFLNADLLNTLGPNVLMHPWLKEARDLPHSKIQQIADVVDSQNFYLTPCPYADTVHPIISQPVIECCIQIPTYVLTAGGTNRALARRAFADDLPPQIVWRTTKGATTGYFNRLIMNDIHFLREYLLEGALAAEQIVDRSRLELALSEPSLILGRRIVSLLAAIRAETWLRNSRSVSSTPAT